MVQYESASDEKDSRTAFRLAEKKYQLHWEQKMSYRCD
jgi:hypothetical protein